MVPTQAQQGDSDLSFHQLRVCPRQDINLGVGQAGPASGKNWTDAQTGRNTPSLPSHPRLQDTRRVMLLCSVTVQEAPAQDGARDTSLTGSFPLLGFA